MLALGYLLFFRPSSTRQQNSFKTFAPNANILLFNLILFNRNNFEIRFYNLDPKDIINGEIKYGGKTYKSISKLSVEDVKLVATEAKLNKHFDLQVRWLQTMPEALKKE